MLEQKALFIAISGMRGSGRTKLFKQLGPLLPDVFGNQTFAFFEDPFGGLPHPLLWATEECGRDPVSRLFSLWSVLNEFNIKHLRPALASNDVVLVDGYGLNALLYSTACAGGSREDDENAIQMHHEIVRARVIKQGIPPPEYFITLGGHNSLVDYLQENVPGIDIAECYAFIRKEERVIRDYFRPETGQRGQIFDHSLSIDDMAEDVILAIRQHLDQKRQAAA